MYIFQCICEAKSCKDLPVKLEVVDERVELAERVGDHVEDARVAQELDSRRQRLDVLQLGLQASDFESELHIRTMTSCTQRTRRWSSESVDHKLCTLYYSTIYSVLLVSHTCMLCSSTRRLVSCSSPS